MARLVGALLLGLVAVLCQESLAEYSDSELYDKLKRLFQDKRVANVADQVKMDMKAEEEATREEKKSDLLDQLARALNKKQHEASLEDRDATNSEERGETDGFEEENDLAERGDESLSKRILHLLKKARYDFSGEEWINTKPNRTAQEGYEECFMTNREDTYNDLWPNECRYVLEKYHPKAVICRPFCRMWVAAMKKLNGGDADGTCKYDNVYQSSICNVDKVKCTDCSLPEMKHFCCGTCLRIKCLG